MSAATASQVLPVYVPQQASGRVVDILSDGSVVVESEGLGWQCRRAASCLLMPESGDTVLFARSDDEKLWLLAVLERSCPEHQAQISVKGGLSISTSGGALTLNSEQQLVMNSHSLQIKSAQGECAIGTLEFQGDEVNANIRIGRWIGDRCESVWHTVTHLSQLLFRQVKQTEHVRAGQLDYQAQDYLRMHARSTLITSEKITKIDSDQIHVG
ncbi:DUF3540 domain-containing protein [Serratia sp. DD3]|uniref:DUF3540 domain-containing protein n=1 Tax=Serratia sp. DD3 TaxID=1410619 RepID=UPI0003C504F2|nr:DUF3540 domain-containing protein [Serratia sp. DD3]KEY58746.1 hypothetical protein SRDD_24420 [Serratia sp. DD3]